MLVNKSNFEECFAQLLAEARAEKVISFDTETTALFWWESPHYAIKPRVFSCQFSTKNNDYYFDFGCQESLVGDSEFYPKPLDETYFEAMRPLWALENITWFIHNAKFDMHHMKNHGVDFAGTMHCTQAIARVMNNVEDERKVSLDSLSEKYLGANKVDLSSYWDESRVTKVKRPGENGKYYDFLHFDRLPLSVLVEYGERDTRLCYRLGQFQLQEIARQNELYFAAVPSNFGGSLLRVLDNERELTKTLFHVERHGVKLDLDFVKAAHKHSCDAIQRVLSELDADAAAYVESHNAKCEKEADKLQRMDWNSGVHLKGLFDSLGMPYNFTELGNATFDKDALESSKSPIAAKILEYRRHSKRAHTYLENYLWLADTDGILHCSFAQGGPRTGRMSCRDPNLQNVPKRSDKKEADFILRKCFIPRPGKVLVSLDYDQVEYRMMLDYAREVALVERILKEGLDVHDATQVELSLDDRDEAKTMNFQIIYGGGVAKLAFALFPVTCSLEVLKAIYMLGKWPHWRNRDGFDRDKALRAQLTPEELTRNTLFIQQAQAKMDFYFEKLPNVQKFVTNVKKKAKDQGVIFTWLGRVLRYGKDEDGRSTDYKAPNGLIQGGAGDVSKVACNLIHKYIVDNMPGSHLLLQVHDELVEEVDISEVHLVKEHVAIMEGIFPHRLIPLTAGAAWSEKSWGDLKDGLP
jgi:DNA polymerase I